MDNKYHSFFDKTAPATDNEEFLKGVLRKAEAMETNKKHRTTRPLIAACAAAAVLGLGVTAAAATGLLDISGIFGGKIMAHNEYVSDNILAHVDDFTFTTNDDSYTMTLDGVTGTENSVVGSFTISRTDGKPVYEDLPAEPEPQVWGTLSDATQPTGESSGFSHHVSMKNDADGNIKGYFELTSTNNIDLTGSTITVYFDGIRNGLYDLPLAMGCKFTYKPSADSLETVKLSGTDTPYIQTMNNGNGEEQDVEHRIVDSELGCIGGFITVNYTDPTIGNIEDMWFSSPTDERIALILNDGTEITASISSCIGGRDSSGMYTSEFQIEYRNGFFSPITAIAASDISAVRFNGTEYPVA